MNYQCEIKEQSVQPVLSIRARTPVDSLPALIADSYDKIATYLAELGAEPAGAPFAAYYNMDMQDLDVEVGFPVAQAQAGKGEIQAGQVPGGKLAFTIHQGSYRDIAPAYEALKQFIEAQGHQPTGVAYEFYLNDPDDTAPEALMTQIALPLKAT